MSQLEIYKRERERINADGKEGRGRRKGNPENKFFV